jgi:hypothetical protein
MEDVMSLASKEYVSRRGAGDRRGCLELLIAIDVPMRALANEGVIKGSLAKVFYTVDELDAEDIEPADALAVTGNRLPLVWLNITYSSESTRNAEFDALTSAYEFVEINSFVSDLPL